MKKIFDDDEFQAELTSLFLSEGMSALSVGEIAARMRCSRRRLYELAGTKEELFCRMIQRYFDSVLKEGNQVIDQAQGNSAEVLTEYFRVGAKAGSTLSTPFLLDLERLPEAKRIFDEYQNARAVVAEQLLEQGIREGFFVPCHVQLIVETLRAAAQRLRQPEFLTKAGMTMDQAFDEFYRVMLGGLLEKRPGEPEKGKAPRARKAKTPQ
ncbi:MULTISPECIES: TetR/AcrR family transcriptional regulator [Pseudomonas]|uniref:TetR/AcrR family transcriptional regulator n=1 Tax=Pseudomonas TaxID=286 RepID=UPI0003B5CC91|nr:MULTISPECIES: TetR/AcrR family transcriptional regulator [Pseudomonas]AZC18496.1 Transcriptional regulator, TetR family [Pseudomonas sp. CMR5c]ERO60018.1 hypothetical protein P308_16040 [Pseudomonas piscis]